MEAEPEEPELPSAQMLIREFTERHHLNATEIIARESVAIYATPSTNTRAADSEMVTRPEAYRPTPTLQQENL